MDALLDAFLVLFATMGPLKVSVAFAEDTHGLPTRLRHLIAVRVVVVATIIALLSLVLGELLIKLFHFSLPALEIAGGLLLFIYAAHLVFAEPPKEHEHVEVTEEQARRMAVYPLAMPILINPVAIAALITISAEGAGQVGAILGTGAVVLVEMALNLGVLWVIGSFGGYLRAEVWQVAERVMGVLLAALGVEIVFTGMRALGLLADTAAH
jgi:multiple antibiotic resistance protein